MITLKEFWESKEKLAIHCKTEVEAKKLLCAFDRMGKKRSSGGSYVKENFWGRYKEKTCYSNIGKYDSVYFYKNGNYTIYEFDEINDFHFNVGDIVRIRQWQDMVNEYGVNEDGDIETPVYLFKKNMELICGNEYKIVSINKKIVRLDHSVERWGISTYMLEKVYYTCKENNMKVFTEQDLAEFMGLKIGDKIKTEYCICELTDDFMLKRKNDSDCEYPLTSLIGVEFDILPQKKKLGDMKCKDFNLCNGCPLLYLHCCKGNNATDDTLYSILENYSNIKEKDKELYEFTKKRLDQEVEE